MDEDYVLTGESAFSYGDHSISKVLVPTVERAIVENIKYDLEFIYEGYFLDNLERYYRSNIFNRALLNEVSEHFGVSQDKIDYWLSECEDYNSY